MNFKSVFILLLILSGFAYGKTERSVQTEISSLKKLIKKTYLTNFSAVLKKRYDHPHPANFIRAMKRLEKLYYLSAQQAVKKKDKERSKKDFQRYQWFREANEHLVLELDKPDTGLFLNSHFLLYAEKVIYPEDKDRAPSKNSVIGGTFGLGYQKIFRNLLLNGTVQGFYSTAAIATKTEEYADTQISIFGIILTPSVGVQVNRLVNLYFGFQVDYRKFSISDNNGLAVELKDPLLYGFEFSTLVRLKKGWHLSGGFGFLNQSTQARLGIAYFL
jgi:hypothetical protein